MRKAGKVVAEVLDILREAVRPGVSTAELDKIAERHILSCGAKPAFKGYRPCSSMKPFPAAICASVNEEVVHGIPSASRILEEGDIISVDVGSFLNGYHGDAACTYPVGKISDSKAALLKVTEESLNRAVAVSLKGNTIGDIGHAVESFALSHKYGVVRDYTGHGLGKKLHEAPQVPNFGKPGRGVTLQIGMTLAIEPMIMAGREEVLVGSDGWVVVTADGSDAAHFERSIVITDEGPEILTQWTSV